MIYYFEELSIQQSKVGHSIFWSNGSNIASIRYPKVIDSFSVKLDCGRGATKEVIVTVNIDCTMTDHKVKMKVRKH